jgi:hypothetical protein
MDRALSVKTRATSTAAMSMKTKCFVGDMSIVRPPM